MRYWLVVPAAGTGRRFGDALPKQYVTLHGRTLLEWALAPFLGDARCRGIVVALAPGDEHWDAIAPRLPGVRTTTGGTERSLSVRNALRALEGEADPKDWVAVHDAARPCLTAQDRDRLLAEGSRDPAGGLLAARVTDTLKRAGESDRVEATVNRDGLWRALTPQLVRFARLCEALDRAHAAGRFPTDEAQAVEWLGDRPRLIAASAANVKVTTAEDLAIAAAVLANREGAKP